MEIEREKKEMGAATRKNRNLLPGFTMSMNV